MEETEVGRLLHCRILNGQRQVGAYTREGDRSGDLGEEEQKWVSEELVEFYAAATSLLASLGLTCYRHIGILSKWWEHIGAPASASARTAREAWARRSRGSEQEGATACR